MGSRLRDVPRGARVFAGRQDNRCRTCSRHSNDVGFALRLDGDIRFHHLSRIPEEIKRAAREFVFLSGRVRPLVSAESTSLSCGSTAWRPPAHLKWPQWKSTEWLQTVPRACRLLHELSWQPTP